MEITTKYNIGDEFYFLYERKIVKTKISKITTTVSDKGIISEKYCIEWYEKNYGYRSVELLIDNLEKFSAVTKEEMFNKLFDNIA